MREIGIRDLKASLSEVIRSVGDGEQVRVTMRGRAVADIVPVGAPRAHDRISELVTAGRLTPASRPRPSRRPRPGKSTQSASDLVLAERDEER
jgi:prevent-host-death family protein